MNLYFYSYTTHNLQSNPEETPDVFAEGLVAISANSAEAADSRIVAEVQECICGVTATSEDDDDISIIMDCTAIKRVGFIASAHYAEVDSANPPVRCKYSWASQPVSATGLGGWLNHALRGESQQITDSLIMEQHEAVVARRVEEELNPPPHTLESSE